MSIFNSRFVRLAAVIGSGVCINHLTRTPVLGLLVSLFTLAMMPSVSNTDQKTV